MGSAEGLCSVEGLWSPTPAWLFEGLYPFPAGAKPKQATDPKEGKRRKSNMFVRVCLFPGQMYQIMASRDLKLFLIGFYDLILSPPNVPI